MSTAMPMPTDILFAQKASSCVKAAGMDPRQMDLKRFYKLAAVIFTRAYIGIYKENDSGMIHEPQTDEDMINNAQKVIDGLLTKTNDPDIMSVSGADIVSGDHKAVDAIVSVLYAEGNRLWLKKLSRIEESRQQVQRDEQSCVSEPMQRKKKNGKRARRKASEDALNSDNQDGAKEDMRSRSEMDDDRRMDQANNDDRVEYGHSEDYKAIAIAQVGGVRRKRPSSAPSHSRSKNGPRGRIALAQAAAVERLFSTGRHKEALEQHLAQQAITQQESSSAKQSGERREDRTHTYDMKSGRKILLTQAYLDAAARQRKVEAVGNLKNASDIEGNQSRENRNRNNESSLPPVPSRPEWPGKSTGASVDRWIKRMLIARTGDEIDSSYSHPRHFSAYRIMEKLDMVISIEHCFNCAHHSLSLRHDPNEYSKNTDTVLRAVAQLAHECGLCARVGVTRMKAKITSKCKHTDVDSRIGAFEVQVAFKDSDGVIFTELLHSKLASRHWPNKSAMEKKLKLFVISSGIAVHPLYDPNQCSDGYKSEGLGTYPVGFVEWEDTPLADTTWTFPVTEKEKIIAVETMNPLDMLKNGSKEVVSAVVPTPLARQRSSSFIDLNANLSNNDENDKSLNVQWVFDARTIIGVVQKPIVTYTPAPNRVTATQITAPIPPKQRPASASAVRPTSTSTSTATSTLVKLNVRQLSAKNSQKSLISLESERDNNERNENNEANQNNQSNKSNQSNKEVASSSSSQSRNIIDQLKKIASDMIGKGRENQPLFSFNPILLVKKGFLSAETTALSVFLRKVVIAYCRNINTVGNTNGNTNGNINTNTNGNSNGNVISADTVSAGISAVFNGVDLRGVGTLNVDDIKSLLTQLLGRSCSDIAISLLLLSIDTDGNGEISPTEFQLFINNYESEINCSLFSNDILEDNENDNENGSEISQELGVLCMLIRSHFLSPDYVKKTEDTNLSPLQKFYSDITSCIAKSEKKISERKGSIVDSECDFKLFLDILMKYEINLLIGDIGIKLIQKAFCTSTNTSKIRATDFISWMQSAGESSVEGVVSGVSAVGVIDIPKIIIPTTTVPVTSPVPVPARTGSSTNITPISKPGSEKQKQPTTSEKLKLSTSSEKLKLAIATASSSSVVQVQVPAVVGSDNKDNGEGNVLNTSTISKTGTGSGSAVSSGKQKEGSEKQPVEIEKNPVVSDEIPVETDVDLNRVYDDRDLFFSGVVVEGLALMQKTMHHLQISVVIGENTQYASVCPAKERGTAKRTFKVDWKAIKVKAADFKSQSLATITMTAKGQNSDEEWEATNTVKLSQFMVALNTTFNVVLQLKLPPHVGDSADTVDGIKVSPKTRTAVTASSEVMITLTGTSREASEAASRRISMMKTADLIRVTFDPLPADDDFSSPVISASGSPTHGTPTGQRSLSLTGMNKITDNFSTLNMIAEGRDSEIDFGVDGEMIDIIPASTGAVVAPRVRTQSQSRPQSQGQSQNQTQSGSQPRSGSQSQVPNVSNVNTPSQDRDSGKQVNDTQRTPSRRMSDLTQDESQFQGKGQDTNKDDDVEVDVEVDAPVTPPTDDSPPHEPMSFDEYLASSYQDNDSDDEEMKDYDIDFSPDTVTQTPETLLSPVKKSITKIDNKEKDKVQEKVPIIADTKTAQKESIKSKTEIIASPEAYDDDDYEVDFEDF